MSRADHIFVKRTGFTHHGIDCGDGTVIHYTGEVGKKVNAAIRRAPVEEFLKGGRKRVRRYGKCDPPDVVIGRAEGRLDEAKYHLVWNNCEHFATWCKTGRARSGQVEDVTATVGGGVAGGAAVAGGIGVVAATGEVAGLSAAGIMSGLATVGSVGGVVSGGVVAGIAGVGALPAVASGGVMLYVLRDDETLDDAEREARRAGRWATVGGAAGGTAAAVGSVAAFGSVTGLSAAGITSGLAAVGGGTMLAGVAVTAALPAVLAAGSGYGIYRLWKALRK